MPINRSALDHAVNNVKSRLLDARTPQGHWVGHLSSSALSTATTTCALALVDRSRPSEKHRQHVTKGLDWLRQHQNPDGGWGDTIRSQSNLSTSVLCRAAFIAADEPIPSTADDYVRHSCQSLEPEDVARAIINRYEKDRTFSTPILTMCALANTNESNHIWPHVPQLPFELAALPHRFFKWMRLPVVSYALPALIAIGQVRHHHHPTHHPLARLIRGLSRQHTLKRLERLQPTSGGFLEAVPLTSFVIMSLASAGLADHPVIAKGVEFLTRLVRPDGSWPIDSNLATWLTTLSVNALGGDPDLSSADRTEIRDWLLDRQYRQRHPYTDAEPGGWAWTDLPGGVPDADDTAGALLALRQLGPIDDQTREAAANGVRWLMRLQNRDGGIPTFCRGWGTLPFDRSCPDITAHALQAATAWSNESRLPTQRFVHKAIQFLAQTQRTDGAWAPLWFGNEAAPHEMNLTYGTSRVLVALPSSSGPMEGSKKRAVQYLVSSQNKDGGWGGAASVPSSIEETALAVEALASIPDLLNQDQSRQALETGTRWLIEHTTEPMPPAPIGFYFARLWYYEKLYPLIFTTAALRRVQQCLDIHS